jgi:hypothetical protein
MAPGRQWRAFRGQREDQVFLVLTLLIGALVGVIVVAFILFTEQFGARLYPVGASTWRRLLVPVGGSLAKVRGNGDFARCLEAIWGGAKRNNHGF